MADIASESVDAARIAAVSAAVGPRRLRELLLILGARIENLATAAELFPEAAEDCIAALHQSRGSASSLGLVALAEALARMEAYARHGGDVGAVKEAGRALRGVWREAKEGLLF
jgi:HPt (histidine-containing phosphotransfer) domain-containing protein